MRRRLPTIIATLGVVVALLGLLLPLDSPAFADPGDGGPTELPGLRPAPHIPVGSIPVVSPHRGHPPAAPPGGAACDKDVDLTSTIKGVVSVAAVNTRICTNADLDVYARATKTYVVQAGGEEAAWTHTDVSNPSQPVRVGQFKWTKTLSNAYTPDIKAFKQGDNDYIVMGLERLQLAAVCGVVIVDVTAPANPVIKSQYIGADWCDVHNVFVEKDEVGEGAYVYATADNNQDLRVLDIKAPGGSVSAPAEIGNYFRYGGGFFSSGYYDDVYVHDVTVRGGVVYASYWSAGLDIFDASLIRDEDPATYQRINSTNLNVVNIDPPNFASGNPYLVHHAFPSADGSLVALQDEIEINSGARVVQLWRTSLVGFVDGLAQGSDIPLYPAHNLEIRDDIFPNRLFVGWYKAGLEAWNFSNTGFARDPVTQGRTSVQYHQVQTEATDDAYDGAWGVRLANITTAGGTHPYIFTSDRRYGLIVDCVGCSPTGTTSGTGTIKGTVTDANSGARLGGVLVQTDTGQSAMTNNAGKYNINNVPVGNRTVTASKPGYVGQSKPATVVAGQTTTEDFALVPVL